MGYGNPFCRDLSITFKFYHFVAHQCVLSFFRACELEDSEACWMLSTWYLGPQTKFKVKGGAIENKKRSLGELQRNADKALEYGIRACEMNVPQSCANVSRFVLILLCFHC